MGLTAASAEIVTGAGRAGLSAVSTEGTAVGGVVAMTALIYALAYVDLLNVSKREYGRLWRLLTTAIVPLGMVFVATVSFYLLFEL